MSPLTQDVLRSPGRPLPAPARELFEPYFGHDFSRVRVHSDTDAAASARGLGAHAYAVGDDNVFGAGEFAPTTETGKRILAHELAHVVQQAGSPRVEPLDLGAPSDNAERAAEAAAAGRPERVTAASDRATVRRLSFGSGVPPHALYSVVPKAERPRVEQATTILSRVVSQPQRFRACHAFYKKNCPGGTDATLTDVFNGAILWKDADPDPDVMGSSIGAHNIAYTNGSYVIGRWAIAASLVHELIHDCGLHGAIGHARGDLAKTPCGRLPDL